LKQLIINGDDFGASPSVNEGILESHRRGILTSTSLMVAEPAAVEAAAAARDYPNLDVGLHLVVCKGRSVLTPLQLGLLVDADGGFPDKPVGAGMRYFFNRRLRAALSDEFRAQIERHLELVGYLNHIDGHLNFHVHPVLFDILLELAAEYHVPCIRLPREPVLTTLGLSRERAGRKIVEAVIFRTLCARSRRKMNERGLKATDWLFGLHQSGNLSGAYVKGVLASLPDNSTTEIYFHPALAPAGRVSAAQREVEILTDPELAGIVSRDGIRLTTYGALAGVSQRSDAA